MSKPGEKSGNAAAVQIKDSFHSEETGKRNWKTNALDDIWWKLAVVLTIIVLAVLVVFIVRQEMKTCSTKEMPQVNSTSAATKIKEKEKENSVISEPAGKPKCVEGSIKESSSSFTFQPYTSNELYRASGLEFSFDALMKKANLDLTPLDKTTVPSSNIHYYYNIDRCRIGGGLQVDRRPYIRGPIVFAVDQECSKVYYFVDGSPVWRKYKSSRNIICSSHGIHLCAQNGSRWSFSNSKSTISGMEFQYRALVQKLKRFAIELKPLNFLNSTEPHYFLNVKECASTDLARRASVTTNTRSSLVFATNHECTAVYAFNEVSSTWLRKTGLGSLSCPWVRRSWCQLGFLRNSSATFQFTSYDLQEPKVFGNQYNFTTLHLKLRSLSTDVDLSTLHQMNTTDGKGTKYYLNMDRCLNGGVIDLNASPQIRGPLFFAVNSDCSKVFYFSAGSVRWVAYRSAVDITC